MDKEEIKEEEIDEKIDDEKIEKKKDKKSKQDEKLLKEIEELKKELASWKDKAYRTAADCDNLRKSYEKDHENLLKYRSIGFVEKLLPALDSFHLSLMVKPENEALKNYVKGFEMIYRQILQALTQEGVNQISPNVGDDFNSDNMQAVDVKEGEEDNKVLQVYSNGYILKDRLVRPAMVVVSRKPVIKEDEQKESEEKPLN